MSEISVKRVDSPARLSQLDRIEESIEELAALLERLLSGDQPEVDRAREGFRAYRKRLRSREAT
jgi:hypothetical protein